MGKVDSICIVCGELDGFHQINKATVKLMEDPINPTAIKTFSKEEYFQNSARHEYQPFSNFNDGTHCSQITGIDIDNKRMRFSALEHVTHIRHPDLSYLIVHQHAKPPRWSEISPL